LTHAVDVERHSSAGDLSIGFVEAVAAVRVAVFTHALYRLVK
jgi:hypothetical protein